METVLLAFDSGMLGITLNRPDRLNAFNPSLHQGLAADLGGGLDTWYNPLIRHRRALEKRPPAFKGS